jgi:hypothetical protein
MLTLRRLLALCSDETFFINEGQPDLGTHAWVRVHSSCARWRATAARPGHGNILLRRKGTPMPMRTARQPQRCRLAHLHRSFIVSCPLCPRYPLDIVRLADMLALLTRLVLDGAFDVITPHVVTTLAYPARSAELESAPYRLSFRIPSRGTRHGQRILGSNCLAYVGSHSTVLLGELQTSGNSNAAIDIGATWIEWGDDLSKSAPTRTPAAHDDRIPIGSLEADGILADGSKTRRVAVCISEADKLWFATTDRSTHFVVTVAVEPCTDNSNTDLGRLRAPADKVSITQDSPLLSPSTRVIWSGIIAFTAKPEPERSASSCESLRLSKSTLPRMRALNRHTANASSMPRFCLANFSGK